MLRLELERLENRIVPSTWTVTSTSSSAATVGSFAYEVGKANTDTTAALINFSPTVFTSNKTITIASAAGLTLDNTHGQSITIDGTGAGPDVFGGWARHPGRQRQQGLPFSRPRGRSSRWKT